MRKSIVALFVAMTLLAACSTPMTTREKGAVIGAGAGAAVVGGASRSWLGALLGALFGGIAGGVIGDQIEERDRENECLRNLRPGESAERCRR